MNRKIILACLTIAFASITTASAEISCRYERRPGSRSQLTQKITDTGKAAVGDTDAPEGLDCGGPALCAGEIVCTDGERQIYASAICPSIEGKCPSEAIHCLEGDIRKVDWKTALAGAPPIPKEAPVTAPKKPTDDGGGGR